MKRGDRVEWTPEAIRNFKDRFALTAGQMSEMLGCNRSYIFLLLKGERQPSEILCKLLDCLNKNTADDGNNEPVVSEIVAKKGHIKPEPQLSALQLSQIAISQLRKITINDPERIKAFEEIERYIWIQKAIDP